jgi:quercetin dioxygenase-like cupin family protein
MHISTQLKCVCAAALAAGGIATVAIASPPINFGGEGLVAADRVGPINIESLGGVLKFHTTQDVDTAVVKLVFGANSSSGWHHHPGMVLVQVAEGQVTVTDASCNRKVYGVGKPNGSVFVEDESVHRVTSQTGAVAYATAIVRNANPKVFRVEDSRPACA